MPDISLVAAGRFGPATLYVFGITVAAGRFGPVTLYVFGITVAAGVLVGMAAALMQARRFGLSESRVFEVSVPALVAGVIGARLAYVVANFSDYRPALTSVVNLTEGGFAFYGGLAGGIVVAVMYAHRVRLPLGRVLDAAAPGLAMGQAVGFIGVHVAGREGAVPWAVLVDGRMLHPFPAYGIILAYCIFITVWTLGGRAQRLRPGRLFLVYLLLHGFGTAIIGTWAAGARWGGLTPGQWAGLAVAIVAIVGLMVARRGPLRPGDGVPSLGIPAHPGVVADSDISVEPDIRGTSGISADSTSEVIIARVYGLRPIERSRPAWQRLVSPALWLAGLALLLMLFRARL